MTETLLLASILIPCLIIAIVFHEVAHGWTALMLGDPTAKERNRLSLNPIRHVDPVGTLLVPGGLALAGLPVFGWAKPVPVIKQRLNNPRFGMMAVAAAGPGTNFVLALVGAVLLGLVIPSAGVPDGQDPGLAVTALSYFIAINIFLALFNLLPIPPFDGSHVVEGLLPPSAARVYDRLRPFGFPLLFILLLVVPYVFPQANIIENVVLPPVEWAMGKYFALSEWIAGV
ncbi:site-2 protease family protein [Erythrobacter alti]|uniref:site-2 protease family protein n=1 Tax=Erythrobacter alti TaxID=1896145 RepID=UPI0030F43CD3